MSETLRDKIYQFLFDNKGKAMTFKEICYKVSKRTTNGTVGKCLHRMAVDGEIVVESKMFDRVKVNYYKVRSLE